ncbi:MAG: RNA 2'-phosphotransferase [Saprospiraceae bacterium]
MHDKSLSKFLSLVLRHKPESIGLELDPNGWAPLDLLIQKMREHGRKVDLSAIQHVVEHNDKQRFSLDMHRRRIRANQGHSIAVDLELPPAEPPMLLYHGTAAKNTGLIAAKGLVKGRRQHVHLSADIETATRVGGRHGQPIVLTIHAKDMHDAGYTFFISANGVWLTDHVPVEFIAFESPNAPA